MTIDGYDAEPHEVHRIVQDFIGELDGRDEPESMFAHLSSRLALLQAATERVSALRDDLVAGMVAASTERDVAERLLLSPSRPGQLARRSRRRRSESADPDRQ